MTLWTAREIAKATGAEVKGDWQVDGVSIDTRTIQKGDLFVALTDTRDGHDFVAQALHKGASAALVSHIPDGVDAKKCALVPDVLAALVALGKAARARTSARVIAVTGSVGKTSTKEMLRSVLAGQGKVHAAEASYNNHWGVPLTLARMPTTADFAVIEIGMSHAGEIAPLAKMARPHIAIITTVAPAHLEAFASIDDIAEEKATIFEGLEPGGTAIYPIDLATSPILAEAASKHHSISFGESANADVVLSHVNLASDQTVFQASLNGSRVLAKLATPGRHFAANAMAVLAAIAVLDLDLAIAVCDLGAWMPPDGRGTRETILMDLVHEEAAFELIDDAFNANPASMAAALEVLTAALPKDGIGRVAKGRRIAILGDMLELGPLEGDLHRAIADHPALTQIDLIHSAGPRMFALHKILPEGKRGHWQPSAEDLAREVKALVDGGDVVLVKGSKGSKISLVAEALRRLGQPLERRNKGDI
ncbi:MAG: UDP-N-acetylmuramoyl-tripeptide--D-alanyl-D-alanine ligase [Deltaproteobacteria bacterium]